MQLWILGFLLQASLAQLSKPLAKDGELPHDNKYQKRNATLDNAPGNHTGDRAAFAQEHPCLAGLNLRWVSDVSSSIVAAPLITDLYSDGQKEIIVPSFLNYLEVIEGSTGGKPPGWPALHESQSHASPLMYDIDLDGTPDILLPTYNGHILFFKDVAEMLKIRLAVPRLQVKRDWYKGLKPDHTDHSSPDVAASNEEKHNLQAAHEGLSLSGQQHSREDIMRHRHSSNTTDHRPPGLAKDTHALEALRNTIQSHQNPPSSPSPPATPEQRSSVVPPTSPQEEAVGNVQRLPEAVVQQHIQQQLAALKQEEQGVKANLHAALGSFEHTGVLHTLASQSMEVAKTLSSKGITPGDPNKDLAQQLSDARQQTGQGSDAAKVVQTRRRLMAVQADGGDGAQGITLGADQHGELTQEAEDSEKVFDEHYYEQYEAKDDKEKFGDHLYEMYYPEYSIPAKQKEQRAEEYWGKRLEDDKLWYDEDYLYHDDDLGDVSFLTQYTYVDPHILATPAIGDLDGDGNDDLVVGVSYFFDRSHYDKPEHRAQLPTDLDLGNYFATGVVVYDLHTRVMKWQVHLDLTTEHIEAVAMIIASPTVADIDRDGKLEVIVGTEVGFLYLMDHTGAVRKGWPKLMGGIPAQPVVADINQDGLLEIIAVDKRGSIAVFTPSGEEVWERHVKSAIEDPPRLGDIDGDGRLDLVFGTASGHVFALDARTGVVKRHWPLKAGGGISAPILLIDVAAKGDNPEVVLVFPSDDGFLYVVGGDIGGEDWCTHAMDIGEEMLGQVLADDLLGNGLLQLVVTTMNGNVMLIDTAFPALPLRAWPEVVPGRGVATLRSNWEGIHVVEEQRKSRDIHGKEFLVSFKIIDDRPELQSGNFTGHGPYLVKVVIEGVGVHDMKAGDSPVIGLQDTYSTPGQYTVSLPAPRSRCTAKVVLQMYDEHRLLFTDYVSLSFHMHYHKLLKWLLVAPFTLMVAVLLAWYPPRGQLPS